MLGQFSIENILPIMYLAGEIFKYLFGEFLIIEIRRKLVTDKKQFFSHQIKTGNWFSSIQEAYVV